MQILIAVLLIVLSATCRADETIMIPLESIWAYKMQGTRDVHGLDLGRFHEKYFPGWGFEDYERERETAIKEIQRHLSSKAASDNALSGFVIPRLIDLHTLRKIPHLMEGVMRHGKPENWTNSFPVGDEMTLVFFSHPLSYYIQLTEVARTGKNITVSYKPIPHYTSESTVHFALIPLGQLPAGEYRVQFKQVGMAKEFYKAGFAPLGYEQQKKHICQTFSFTIWEPPRPDDSKLSENAVVIPLKDIWGHKLAGTKDVYELETNREQQRQMDREELLKHSPVLRIGRALSHYQKNKPAGDGFVVKGFDNNALLQVDAVFAEQANRIDDFVTQDDLTLCFFSHSTGRYVALDQVVREGTEIIVKYHFAAHNSRDMSYHFALIPLGKLPAGDYHVEMKQLPGTGPAWGPPAPPIDPERVKQLVCGSFDFKVKD